MIYTTFNQVQDDYTYAQKLLHSMMERAETYIKDVLHEAGTVEITVDNKPTVIALKGKRYEEDEHVVFYQNVAKPKMLWDFNAPELFDICKEIRAQHFVDEYGDNTEKEAA